MRVVHKIFENKLLDNSIYFKIVFILWALVHSVSVGQHVTGYFSPIMILWGGLLVVRNIFIKKIDFKKGYVIAATAFSVSYIITIIINRDLNFISNTKTLIWLIIVFFALLVGDSENTIEGALKDLKNIGTSIVIPTFAISAYGIGMFFFNVLYWIEKGDTTHVPQGYYAARLWGVYADPNEACNVAIISIVFSIIVIYLRNRNKTNKGVVIFNVTNIIVQYLFIVLSASRGGMVGLAVILIGGFYIVFERLIKSKVQVIRVAVSVLIGIVLTIGILLTFQTTRKVVAYVPETISQIRLDLSNDGSDSEEEEEKEEIKDITTVRPDNKTSNGRVELWTSAIKLSTKAPIFGYGDRNYNVKAKEVMPELRLALQHPHNGYLHVLLSGGLVALVLILILVTIIAWRAFMYILNHKERTTQYYIISILSILALSMLATTVFLSELFYQNSFTTLTFWTILGYVIVMLDREKSVAN